MEKFMKHLKKYIKIYEYETDKTKYKVTLWKWGNIFVSKG